MIHIVDDDPSVGRALSRLLRSHGLHCQVFTSAPESLAEASRSEASCLIIDVHMPRMNGYDLARQLADVSPEIPVIFITAQADEAGRWQAATETAVGLLIKPFTEDQLIGALEQALGFEIASGATN